ncbi:EAL domain-containing protein [Aliikangiella marina]|uniref:EAL domain-containing protein n=1 Tax=Aliikangiella marina TaxID=1712262 RepID=A0A545T930_9GAMM|nr:EAL domain-containing protein [Aliikangiella marina]TQV73721.1 EAL domain-containing protein [Aliikangiella marina]
MHKLLLRQLKRNYPVKEIPADLQPLVNAISDAYKDYDYEQQLLERSLELVSEELNLRNLELKQKFQQLEETHQQLAESAAVLDGIFDATGEAIFAFDRKGRLVRYNQTAREILKLKESGGEYSKGHIAYMFRKILADPSKFLHELRRLKSFPKNNLFGVIEFSNDRLFEYHSTPQFSGEELVGRVWCFRNVTQIKENEALVQYQAFHDSLTGLPNRVLLLDRINHSIALSERKNEMIALLFIDLDHFKKVNDTEGHQVGDELLKEVAQRIRDCLREHDTLARFGGDEFVVLLDSVKSSRIAAKTSRRIIDSVSQPYEIMDKHFHISASIGVSMYPRDDTEPQELIRKADMAMYHAKEQGRSNYEFFDSPLERLAHFQLELENKLRQAIANQELTVFYQPQVETQGQTIKRMEALLRWFPVTGSAISPADFVPVAERAGLISDVGLMVLEKVCETIVKWRQLGAGDFCISVNLSAQQIAEGNLVEHIERLLSQYNISGQYLEVEITESILMENLENVTAVLNQIRELGITVAIDDFGTGYSSLKYLQKLPIDILKIDRSFINNVLEDKNKQSIVNAIVLLGHGLKLQLVAEGAEDKPTVDFLTELGCEFIQGFYFYKPMPAQEIERILFKPE